MPKPPESSAIVRCAALLAIAAMSACVTSPVYMPNTLNTPQLMQRGDAEAGVYVSPEGFTQIQASAAITQRFAVVANANYINAGCAACTKRQHRFVEVGVGTFHTDLDDRTVTWLAGFGAGRSNWVSKSFSTGLGLLALYRAEGDYTRGFIQVGGVDRRERFDVATSIRVTGVFFSAYNQYSLDSLTSGRPTYTKPRKYDGRLWGIYAEPSVRMLWHVKAVRIGPQFGFSFPIMPPPAFGHRPASMSLGVDVGGR